MSFLLDLNFGLIFWEIRPRKLFVFLISTVISVDFPSALL